MTSDELRKRLLALDADKLQRLMQVVVKDHVDRHPETAEVLTSGELLAAALRQAADGAGLSPGAIVEPRDKAEALRAIATALADEPSYAELLSNALAGGRATRVDPITAAIVLAGIVLVLQTRFDVGYDVENGKKKLHIKLSKAPTSESLITKLFGLFK